MSDLIKRDDALEAIKTAELGQEYDEVEKVSSVDAVPIKFIDEVIEYLTKCRDNAIHEETQTAWDEQRQTLIMLLHEWAAWNECGRTGKYGERREG